MEEWFINALINITYENQETTVVSGLETVSKEDKMTTMTHKWGRHSIADFITISIYWLHTFFLLKIHLVVFILSLEKYNQIMITFFCLLSRSCCSCFVPHSSLFIMFLVNIYMVHGSPNLSLFMGKYIWNSNTVIYIIIFEKFQRTIS